MGFDQVFEIGYACEYYSEVARIYVKEHSGTRPWINSTCPSVERLIRVRFPNLIHNLLPLIPPAEISADAALQQAVKKTGRSEEKIGLIYIAPCPAQIAYIKSPLGIPSSAIDHALAMKDIYPELIAAMNEVSKDPKPLSRAAKIGIGWGTTCSEASNYEGIQFFSCRRN